MENPQTLHKNHKKDGKCMIRGFARRFWGFARTDLGFCTNGFGFCTKGFVFLRIFGIFRGFRCCLTLFHVFLVFHEEFRIFHSLLSCFPSICVVLAEVWGFSKCFAHFSGFLVFFTQVHRLSGSLRAYTKIARLSVNSTPDSCQCAKCTDTSSCHWGKCTKI